jgi:uncharacterized protein
MKGKDYGLHKVTFILLVIGGLNWLLYALFNWEIGSLFGGMDSTVSTIVYVLVGLSAISELFCHKNCCKACTAGKGDSPAPSQPAE